MSGLDLIVMADDDAVAAVTALYTAGTLGDVLGICAADAPARLQGIGCADTVFALV